MAASQPPVSAIPLFDAYAPAEVAVRVRDIGVTKARTPLLTLIALAVLAGAFISLGTLFYSVSTPGPSASSVP
jgi:formate transporter